MGFVYTYTNLTVAYANLKEGDTLINVPGKRARKPRKALTDDPSGRGQRARLQQHQQHQQQDHGLSPGDQQEAGMEKKRLRAQKRITRTSKVWMTVRQLRSIDARPGNYQRRADAITLKGGLQLIVLEMKRRAEAHRAWVLKCKRYLEYMSGIIKELWMLRSYGNYKLEDYHRDLANRRNEARRISSKLVAVGDDPLTDEMIENLALVKLSAHYQSLMAIDLERVYQFSLDEIQVQANWVLYQGQVVLEVETPEALLVRYHGYPDPPRAVYHFMVSPL